MVIYEALDWGIDSQVERELSDPLDKLLCLMLKLDDEGMKPTVTLQDVIKVFFLLALLNTFALEELMTNHVVNQDDRLFLGRSWVVCWMAWGCGFSVRGGRQKASKVHSIVYRKEIRRKSQRGAHSCPYRVLQHVVSNSSVQYYRY